MALMGGPACESCGRPMMNDRDRGAKQHNNPYCRHCTDGNGTLRSFEAVLKTLAEEEFMARNGMDRQAAEVAARNALAHSPAWRGRR
jgi:hypothetical protein